MQRRISFSPSLLFSLSFGFFLLTRLHFSGEFVQILSVQGGVPTGQADNRIKPIGT
jgi:hypothetical protein